MAHTWTTQSNSVAKRCLRFNEARGVVSSHLRPRQAVVLRAVEDKNEDQPALHPEVPQELCEETLQFNQLHLGALQERIAQIRQAQALHILQHRYTPTTVNEVVEEALESRPDLAEGFHHLATWHEAQWAQLKVAMEAGRDTTSSSSSSSSP